MSSFECCKQGTFHKGTPKGMETTIAGHKAYLASISHENVPALLIVPDVFGWKLNNIRVLADKYAEIANIRVYVVDFFDGEHAPYDDEERKSWDIMSFLGKHHPRDAAWPAIKKVAEEIKAKHGKLGAIGFCWGAPGALRLGGAEAIADAVAFAHPSVTEIDDFKNLTKPGLFLCAEVDQQFPEEKRVAAEHVINEKKGAFFSKFVYYPHTTHGFAVRGDEEDKYTAEAMGDAAQEAALFFKTRLR